jgi:two-component system chemotaxis response regulator CheY
MNHKKISLPRILIVEDSASAQRRLVSTLEFYARCDVSENGQEAVDFVKSIADAQDQVDCIIMDIVMPVKDGLTAVKEIRQLEKQEYILSKQKIKILIVSTVNNPEDILRAQYECEADGYITKPYAKATVLRTLQDIGVCFERNGCTPLNTACKEI